jgi:hypothetical protein
MSFGVRLILGLLLTTYLAGASSRRRRRMLLRLYGRKTLILGRFQS